MQFYNYATRVLLDDLSNIIRCGSIRIAIIIISKRALYVMMHTNHF